MESGNLGFCKITETAIQVSQFLEEGLYLQAQAFFELKQYNSGLEILNELQNTFGQLKKTYKSG